jgi:hypothetical protein
LILAHDLAVSKMADMASTRVAAESRHEDPAAVSKRLEPLRTIFFEFTLYDTLSRTTATSKKIL